MIRFRCANCGQVLQVPDHILGKPVRCSGCGKVTTAPAVAVAVPPVARARAPRSSLPHWLVGLGGIGVAGLIVLGALLRLADRPEVPSSAPREIVAQAPPPIARPAAPEPDPPAPYPDGYQPPTEPRDETEFLGTYMRVRNMRDRFIKEAFRICPLGDLPTREELNRNGFEVDRQLDIGYAELSRDAGRRVGELKDIEAEGDARRWFAPLAKRNRQVRTPAEITKEIQQNRDRARFFMGVTESRKAAGTFPYPEK